MQQRTGLPQVSMKPQLPLWLPSVCFPSPPYRRGKASSPPCITASVYALEGNPKPSRVLPSQPHLHLSSMSYSIYQPHKPVFSSSCGQAGLILNGAGVVPFWKSECSPLSKSLRSCLFYSSRWLQSNGNSSDTLLGLNQAEWMLYTVSLHLTMVSLSCHPHFRTL